MKIGIIGCGKQAPKHIHGIRDNGKLDIVVYDVNREAASNIAQKYDTQLAPTIDSILNDPSVSGIIVATPTPTHFDFISQSLKAKKHVFCEKPLCENLEQAKLLSILSKETGCFVQVGYVYRQVPAFQELNKLLLSPEKPLGNIVCANLRLGGRGDHHLWKHTRALGGGAINEMLVHMVDLASWLFGEITDVCNQETQLLRPKRVIGGQEIVADAEDFVFISGFTHLGNYVSLQADLITPAFSQFIEVQGDNGSFFGSIQEDKPSYFYLIKKTNSYSAGKNTIKFQSVNLFSRQMDEFINNLYQNQLNHSPSITDSISIFNIVNQLVKSN
ncbi:Gfo/Idh/MocA family protein [Legionella sp. CNM-1927-20]|uniref:Gfo/Idh/MocA family protein n=1 Tax=Legionella sp. CNM-1927-20 TaxID=3422221 RepID=UPI00403B04FE